MLHELGIVISDNQLFAKDQSPYIASDRHDGFTIDTNNSCNDDERILGMSESLAPPSIIRQSSILKKSDSYQPRQRTDSQGQLIGKQTKEHKISFNEQLLEVHVVENWKEYNQLEEETQEDKCNCWII